MPAADEARAHGRFGRYRLTGLLARGGMAEVWAAQLVAPGGFSKSLVLKRLRPEHAGSFTHLDLLLAEARVTANLSHPNLCAVFELGEAEGEYFIAMEYLRGATVAELRDAGAVPPAVAAAIVAQACDGLHHAHELELVHRDVSASNLLVTTAGVVKVLDFGIAKRELADTTSTGLKGTVAYMSPEQLDGARLDRRTDVWALGVVLWELLTGDRLFGGGTAVAAIDAIRAGRVRALDSAACPPALAAVVARCLRRSPDDRFASALELRRALADALPLAAADTLASLVTTRCRTAIDGRDTKFTAPDEATQPGGPSSARSPQQTAPAAAPSLAEAPTETVQPTIAPAPMPGQSPTRRGRPLIIGLAIAGALALTIGAGVAINAARDQPAAAKPKGVGRVYLDADPDVSVILYGDLGFLDLGWTPIRGREVDAGTYVLSATRRDGRMGMKTVEVPAGGELRFNVRVSSTGLLEGELNDGLNDDLNELRPNP